MDKYDDGVKVKFKFNPPPEITNQLLPESTLDGTDDTPIDYTQIDPHILVGEKMFKRIIKISEEIESVKKNITEREKRIGFLSVIPVTDDPLSMRWITLRNQLRILTSCKRGEYVYETDDGGLILISNLKIVKMAKEDN